MKTASIESVQHIGVGIDTSRYGHHVSFMDTERRVIGRGLAISESVEGYQRLQQELEKLHHKYPSVHFHIHLDAGGQYATNLEHFIRRIDLPITLSIGEPKRNKDYHQAMSPKRKSDISESRAMARFGVVERPTETPLTPEETYVLREVASRLESQVKSCTQSINRLHNLLSRVFPEMANITANVASGWVLALLDKYPTPERMARAATDSIANIPHVGREKAQKLQTAAKQTVASLRGKSAEQLVRHAVGQVKQAQRGQKELEKLLEEAFAALPASGHRQVATIPGIGNATAAVLVAKMVSIDRFETSDNLVGYFGVFPEEYSSGVDRDGKPRKRSAHMSRKGNDLVRRYLFCAAKSAIVHNPAVRALYRRLRARGTRGDVALGHCMRKLLQLVFAVWKTNQPFNNNHYPWRGDECSDNESSAESKAAQEKTAGPRRDMIPASKEVTAETSTVDGTTASVNCRRSAHSNTASNAQQRRAGSIDYAFVRQQITIEQVLRHIGMFNQLQGRGAQRCGPCPFHESTRDTSRSFSVHLQKHVFHCKNPKCAAQGNALDLWARYRALPLYEATLELANTFGLKINRNREEATRNPKTE